MPFDHPHHSRPLTARELDDIGSNRSSNRTFADVLVTRFSRRAALQGLTVTAAMGVFASLFVKQESAAQAQADFSR